MAIRLFAYDPLGKLLTKTDRKKNTITYEYDALNRLSHKQYPDGSSVNYAYDLSDRLTQITDSAGTYDFSYDNLGQLMSARTQYSFLPGKVFNMTYGYDSAGNRASFIDAENGTSSYANDALNRLASVQDSAGNHFSFSRDNLGRMTQLMRPNGVNTSYAYDAVSNLLSILHQKGNTTVDGASYTVDTSGNRTSKTSLLDGATFNFSYDNLFELSGVSEAASATEAYSYDSVGNRLTSLGRPSLTYNSSNELTADGSSTYTYDDNGNTTSKTGSSGTTHFTWDFENHLTNVTKPDGTVISFSYDPLGRRIRKNASVYAYDGMNLVEELDSSGNSIARYTFGSGIDEPLALYQNGVAGFYQSDASGSVTSLTTSTGLLSDSFAYNAFGSPVSSTGSSVQPFRYSGREFDAETGLYYYRARYYDPSNGRFLSEDPMRNVAGSNYYAYVHNSPVNISDPTGLLDIFIWNFRGSTQAWGHASLSLDNGTHISWWPEGEEYRHYKFSSHIPLYTADANSPQELINDIENEGEEDPSGQLLPDEIIHIEGLDENAIAQWWTEFQRDRRWKTLSRNCSTVVSMALRAGGAQPAHHLIWTPGNVAKYAERIAGQLPGSGFVPVNVYFPEFQPITPWHGTPLSH